MVTNQKSSQSAIHLFGSLQNPATIFGGTKLWGIQEPVVENLVYVILAVLLFVL